MKIAVVGTCPSSRYLAPYADPSWRIWACGVEDGPGGILTSLPRIDEFFELHDNMLWPEHREFHIPYLNWLANQKFDLWMQGQRYTPRAKTFPKTELIERFGPYFFTSTTAWMLAKAIFDGATEIGIYGTDQTNNDERKFARASVHHFIWLAESVGIKISVPMESDIANPPPLYGFSDSTPRGRKFAERRKELEGHIKEMKGEMDHLAKNLSHLEGALEDHTYHEAIWTSDLRSK